MRQVNALHPAPRTQTHRPSKDEEKEKSQTQIVTFVIFVTLPGQQADNALGWDSARTVAQQRPPQPGRKLTKLKNLN